jgi:hypothetical protein
VNIQEITESFKSGVKGLISNDETYTLILVVLVGVAAFGLGRASLEQPASLTAATESDTVRQSGATQTAKKPESLKAEQQGETIESALEEPASTTPGQYVASKSGTKYHLPWCGGAKQIKEENKVWFQTKEEAEWAGYTPAANCKGI